VQLLGAGGVDGVRMTAIGKDRMGGALALQQAIHAALGGVGACLRILREGEETRMRASGFMFRMFLSSWLLLTPCAAALAAGQPAVQEAPAQLKVIASIKPVHSLVSGVMEGTGSPVLLVTGAASEHDYALLPSQAKALATADLIFWVGPQLEVFLKRPLAQLADHSSGVELARSPGIVLLPVSDHEAHSDHSHSDHESDSGDDMHVWLDPANAVVMVQEIARHLQSHDPRNAAVYASNASALQVRITALQNQIQQQLSRLQIPPYIVFHNAYQYFETRFGLKPVAVITLAPEHPPGAARIRFLRKQMAEAGVRCVFMEPQYPSSIVHSLTEGMPARTAVLDPLGASIPDGGELYFSLMTRLAATYTDCAGIQESQGDP